MISFKNFRRFFALATLAVLITTAITVTFNPSQSWAATTFMPNSQIIAMNRGDAIGKDIEGKAQELKGNLTNNSQDKIMGKAKQAQSDAMNAAVDLKDNTKAANKKIENKTRNVVEDLKK